MTSNTAGVDLQPMAKLASVYKDITDRRRETAMLSGKDQEHKLAAKTYSGIISRKKPYSRNDLNNFQIQGVRRIDACFDGLDHYEYDENGENGSISKKGPNSPQSCLANAFQEIMKLEFCVWKVKIHYNNLGFVSIPLGKAKSLVKFWCTHNGWSFIVYMLRDSDCYGGILGCQIYYREDELRNWKVSPSDPPQYVRYYCDLRCQNTGEFKKKLLLRFLSGFTSLQEYASCHHREYIALPEELRRRGFTVDKLEWDFDRSLCNDGCKFRCYPVEKRHLKLWVVNDRNGKLSVSPNKFRFSYGCDSNKDFVGDDVLSAREISLKKKKKIFKFKPEHPMYALKGTASEMTSVIKLAASQLEGRHHEFTGLDIDVKLESSPVSKMEEFSVCEGRVDPRRGFFLDYHIKIILLKNDTLAGGCFVRSNRLPFLKINAQIVGHDQLGSAGYICFSMESSSDPMGLLDTPSPWHHKADEETNQIYSSVPTYSESKYTDFAVQVHPIIEPPKSTCIIEEFLVRNQNIRICADETLKTLEQLVAMYSF